MSGALKFFCALWGFFVIGLCAYLLRDIDLSKDKLPDILRGVGLFVAGIGVAPIGLILAFNRTGTLQEQSENDKKRRVGEEFSRAVELLGHDKAAAREGGIYALGYLAKEEEERHETVVRIVASFIREATYKQVAPIPDSVSGQVNVDVEAALSVIKDRDTSREFPDSYAVGKRQYMFDLSESKLCNGDLSHTFLRRVNMSNVVAENFAFEQVHFNGANMVKTRFTKCDFTGANFNDAELHGAIFAECDFQNAYFGQAELDGADLTGATNLTYEQIKDAKGDAHTKIPVGLKRPRNWH